MKKKSAKEPKKKGADLQKTVDETLSRGSVPSGLPADEVADAAKRKAAGKDAAPFDKKAKKRETGTKAPPVLIVDDQPTSEPPVVAASASVEAPSQVSPLEVVDPKAFLRSIAAGMDRSTLGTYDDDALEDKILWSSLTACIALGEQSRRLEEWHLHKAEQDEKMKKLIHQNSDVVRQMAQLEESLRHMELQVEAVNRGKAEAERSAAEAIKKAAEEAEAAKAEAVAKAREDALCEFLEEGWKAEGRKQWVSSVVEASVEEWCEGPGVEWLARKGKEYYEGGEFFTQALIYRRMDRHLKMEPKDFDPAAYGLPPLQPDVRVPLPPDVERPDLEDSELMKDAEGEGEA
ncbi:unnamed protein product [Cuscuta europaea]|uniref:Uncharacterized protein n=1 Tax=Cuscuta europaea TaxID=41803 RepID=A0A9P1EJG6_CUSEU|nr:unnamed protein product [Cuscuta europaea]